MKVSIITVSLNNRATIAATAHSVCEQTYQNVEYLVIDGCSSDGTIEELVPYSSKIKSITSEPDSGIYDAMNKGITRSTGDIIGFLHADDVYAHKGVLQQVIDCLQQSDAEACYGDLAFLKQGRMSRLWLAGAYSRNKLYQGWMPPHPTFFVRRDSYLRYGGYRTDMGTAADYELMLRYLLGHRVVPVYIPKLLVLMRAGGLSNASVSSRLKAHMMDWKAWRINGFTPMPWTLPLKPIRKLSQWFTVNQRWDIRA